MLQVKMPEGRGAFRLSLCVIAKGIAPETLTMEPLV